jgi:predicted N-acetyltransferase YhbS
MTMAGPVRNLDDGLVLRAVSNSNDVERVAAFDALIHGAGTEATWQTWMRSHPAADAARWLFVEEQATRRVVASLCLLPWRLRFGGVELRAAEMGVVGTLEDYRGRGLQRVLATRFDELLQDEGYLLSHIQGIPYFYRQFGYEYAAPLEAWWRLELHRLAALSAAAGFTCRPATPDDVPMLTTLYDEAARSLDLSTVRHIATWEYLLGPALGTETAAETWLVIDEAGMPIGYFRVAQHGFGEGLIVAEASQLHVDAALASLMTIRDLARERGKPFVRLNLPASTPLVTVARGLGAYDGGAYAWQIRLPDPPALLRTLTPILEQRLKAGPYASLSRNVVIDLYRQAIVLRFQAGRLTAVDEAIPGTPADLRLPPPLLAPVLLGHRTLDEIAHMYPDASAPGPARPLVEALFPKLNVWLYPPY